MFAVLARLTLSGPEQRAGGQAEQGAASGPMLGESGHHTGAGRISSALSAGLLGHSGIRVQVCSLHQIIIQ